MPKDVSSTRIENECIFEIRYKPNSKLLDNRGNWAESISSHMNLEHWQIVGNRFDIFSEDKKYLLFLGYRNGGLSVSNVPNKEFFPNYTNKLLSFVFGLEDFGNPIFIERVGVRCKFCTPFNSSFENLRERYATRYISLTKQATEAIGNDAQLTDIGGHLNFKDNLGNFNTMSGPMPQGQFPQFFSIPGEFPPVGFYYDIDYWNRPKKKMDGEKIIEMISNLFSAAWDRHARVRDLLIKG